MSDRLAATLALDAPVTSIPGVSSGRAAALSRFGATTIRGVLAHYPKRYLDMSNICTIGQARIGENATIVATVHEAVLKRPKPKFDLVEVTLVDGTGTLIVTFFKQPWLVKTLTPGMRVSVAGKVEFNYGFLRMTMPFLDKVDGDNVEEVTGQVIPVHAASEKVPQGQMRRIVRGALSQLGRVYDPLPASLRAKYRLMPRAEALRAIHFPVDMAEQAQARRRLVYEEVLALEMHLMQQAQAELGDASPRTHVVDGPARRAFEEHVPFSLTGDQQRAVADISQRMAAPERMRHMLLGDVGTGKTMVAAFALVMAADSGEQALMMGPTEVLVDQYAQGLGPLLEKSGVTWAKLTGSTPASEREAILEGLASGSISVCFGTHALLVDDVVCHNCGLVIIDEEQRFGVDQREALMAKGAACDVLEMTATPIPRTLALALYGSMTQSYLREIPFERPPRTTKVYGFRERGRAYDVALEACKRGEQVYIVCPLVGSRGGAAAQASGPRPKERSRFGYSGTAGEQDEPVYIDSFDDFSGDDSKAAEAQAKFLQAKTFSAYRVGLLHGRMKAAAKREVMERFRAGEIDVLVSTTVIEVGVDVPNATVMIVEEADKFGLSQLHQLRGRVGRGEKPGFMCLISATGDKAACERLSAMEKTEDGFKLAEYDLSLRREGDILGNRQHGASVLKLVNVVRDGAVIEAAHADAREYMETQVRANTLESKLYLREVDAVFSAEAQRKTHTAKKGGVR